MSSVRHAAAGPRRVWPWVVGSAALLFVALGAAFAWDGVTLLRAKDDLHAHASGAKAALIARDVTALAGEAQALDVAARDFAGATDGPHWWLATHLPWVADQAIPLVAAGEAVSVIAADALGPLASEGSLDALAGPVFESGRMDPFALEPYRAMLSGAASALAEQEAALAAVDLTGTVAQVAGPFADLREQVAQMGSLVWSGHVAAEVMPTMLGGEGARTYLVMIQNNAEPRATGGIPGAVIEVIVDDGSFVLGRYASATSMVVPEGVGGLTDDERRIFTERMEVYPHDVTFTPEFSRSAELMSRFWEAKFGQAPDGVVSVDPVALGWMLEGAPATSVGGFDITGDNLASVMLNEAYLTIEDPAQQDAFFALASAQLFGRLVGGEGNALAGVERAIEARRFMVWTAEPDEQALLATTPIVGGFLEQADALGVFVNDGSGSKIGYYVDQSVDITDLQCADGRVAGQTVSVSLEHGFDGDVSELPDYVSGGDVYVPAGEFHANLVLYPPQGMGVTGVDIDGEVGHGNPETHDGRPVMTTRVTLAPGETTTVTFQLSAAAALTHTPPLVTTPGARDVTVTRSAKVPSTGC